jgi:hypothetical protein
MGKSEMKVVGLALGVWVALTIAAAAETCSERMAFCKGVNAKEEPGPAGQARCEEYHKICMQTGTWTSKQRTLTGLAKQ